MIEKTLAIGDCHTYPEDKHLIRFDNLSKHIIETQPDNLLIIGDWMDLDSLSAYDRDKRAKMEGRRFRKELNTAREALDRLESHIQAFNKRRKRQKKKLYTPRRIFCVGNHEDRWFRYLDSHPEMHNVVNIWEEIGFIEYGWEIVPFREYKYINGIGFTHAPQNAINRSYTDIKRAVKEHDKSVIYGHSHAFGLETFTRHGEDSKQVIALNIGCYFKGIPEYAQGSLLSRDWWRGVVEINHLDKDGQFYINMIPYEVLNG